jgi:hypothetical protein
MREPVRRPGDGVTVEELMRRLDDGVAALERSADALERTIQVREVPGVAELARIADALERIAGVEELTKDEARREWAKWRAREAP